MAKRQRIRCSGKNPNRGRESATRYEDRLIGSIDATRFMSFSTDKKKTAGRRILVKRSK